LSSPADRSLGWLHNEPSLAVAYVNRATLGAW
jgi:hypothetical protein